LLELHLLQAWQPQNAKYLSRAPLAGGYDVRVCFQNLPMVFPWVLFESPAAVNTTHPGAVQGTRRWSTVLESVRPDLRDPFDQLALHPRRGLRHSAMGPSRWCSCGNFLCTSPPLAEHHCDWIWKEGFHVVDDESNIIAQLGRCQCVEWLNSVRDRRRPSVAQRRRANGRRPR